MLGHYVIVTTRALSALPDMHAKSLRAESD